MQSEFHGRSLQEAPSLDNYTAENYLQLLASQTSDRYKGRTFLGLESLYSEVQITHYGYEMAILFLAQVVCFAVFLNHLNGRTLRLRQFLHNLNFEIFGNTVKPESVVNYLGLIGWSIIVAPFLTLFLFTVLLTVDATRGGAPLNFSNSQFVGALSVLLLGTATLLAVLVVMKIRWNNFRFKFTHMGLTVAACLLFTFWQFMILLSTPGGSQSYYGISTVSYTLSALIINLLIFINLYENKFSLYYFLDKYLSRDGTPLDIERENDLMEEVTDQKGDDDFEPSIHDIYDMITIGKVSEKKMLNAFGMGLHSLAILRRTKGRYLLNWVLLTAYVGILVMYAWLVWSFDRSSKLGVVSASAVVLNDFYLVLIYNARVINRISVMSLITFLSRVFIFLGGAGYWVYGYMVVYLWVGSLISLGIVRKRFPVGSEAVNRTIDLNIGVRKVKMVNLLRVPEFIFVLISVLFTVSILLVAAFPQDGVQLEPLPLGEGVPVASMTFICIFLVTSILTTSAWIRVLIRRMDLVGGDAYNFLGSKRIDLFLVVSLFFYFVSTVWTIGIYLATGSRVVLLCGFTFPFMVQFYFQQLIYYMNNGHAFLENVARKNKAIDAHNKKVNALMKNARILRQKLEQDGPEEIYGADNGKLVNKVLALEAMQRKTEKLALQMQRENKGLLPQAEKEREAGLGASSSVGLSRSMTGGKRKMSMASPTRSHIPRATPKGSEKPSSVRRGLMEEDVRLKDIDGQPSANVFESDDEREVKIDPNRLQDLRNQRNNSQLKATLGNLRIGEETSDEDIDAVIPQLLPYTKFRVDKKWRHIPNWRDQEPRQCIAFWSCQMRHNDYRMVGFITAELVLITLFALVCNIYTPNSEGLIYGVQILHIYMVLISLQGNIIANRRQTTCEIMTAVMAYLIEYVAVFTFLLATYDVSNLFERPENLTVEERVDQAAAIDFITYQMIVIPTGTAFVALICKAWRDSTNGKSCSRSFLIFLVLNILNGLAFIVIFFSFVETGLAVGILIALAFFVFVFVQYTLRVSYNANSKGKKKFACGAASQDDCWTTVNLTLALASIAVSIVFAFRSPDISWYAGVTAVLAVACLETSITVLTAMIADRTRMKSSPIYHSPWLLPVYKYYPDSNDVVAHERPLQGLCFLFTLVLFWAVWTVVEVDPRWVGVSFTCVLEALSITIGLYLTNTNNVQFRQLKPYIDGLVIKQAWLDAKENLIKMLQLDDRKSFQSYEVWWQRRHVLRQYLLIWRNEPILKWPQVQEFKTMEREMNEAEDKGAYLRNRLEQWVDRDEVDLDCYEDCLKFLYETDLDVRRAYTAELETVIQFQLIILQNARELQEMEQKYLFKFVKEKQTELYLVGINPKLQDDQSDATRYIDLTNQISRLSIDKQALFNALRDKFVEEQRQKEIDEEIREKEAEERSRERQEAFGMMSQAKKRALMELARNPNMPIDEMPDCPLKLASVRKKNASEGTLFTDTQFNIEDEEKTFGPNIFSQKRQRGIQGWKRASEIEGAVLFRDGASHEDITQGALGDCYFLSALAVLDQEQVVNLFECQKDSNHEDESDPNHWKKTGCFMLKFFKRGEFTYVIVDDYIPVDGRGWPAFTKGGQDGLEMWPAIIEKAYAKLYGSYQGIEAGKVHMALADLTENGFPEQIQLKTFGGNLSKFEQSLYNNYRINALMGAGSPEHELGDRAINEEGIVQGHAYAVLRVEQMRNKQLIQLRNPHGKSAGTAEWNGDWSDESGMWTTALQQQLKYTPSQESDGVFWMSNKDFLANFKYLYIAHELTERAGWFSLEHAGAWKGPNYAGFPGKLRKVPQFQLRITRPTTAFISLTQMDGLGSFKGKNFVGWMISQENNGKLMTKISKQNIVQKEGITDLAVLSGQVQFDERYSYPYTFTLVCGSRYPAPEGEGTFEVKVISRDPNMKLTKLN